MPLVKIALASLLNRRLSAALTVLCIGFALCITLGVEQLRQDTRSSFTHTVSGTDLLVGARAGSLNLLLYSVFRIGHATHNIEYASFSALKKHPQVKWAIPLSLGDSHRGFAVLGTSADYFTHYQYGQAQPLRLAQGRAFAQDPFEVVLGAEVAKALGYTLGQELVLAHGTARVSLIEHDDKPFRVVGVLARTGTPVDRTLHISLAGMQALHLDWRHGMPARGAARISAEDARNLALTPTHITAVAVGLHSRLSTFALQREINQWPSEPLQAILPGVALQELWQLMSTAEKVLGFMCLCVLLLALLAMLLGIFASLNERRREMAILRAVGARPWHIGALLLLEALLLSGGGALLGLLLLSLLSHLAQAPLQAYYGVNLSLNWPSVRQWSLLIGMMVAALLLSLLPAWRVYRQSLTDGLTVHN